ncbi:mip family channel protein [Stylonychia lemnae]|uniref:Mip family channel protein n=1 Tax=Stylonychia lemnae TaxID=5949 RepID=A0A078A869_STYLE|nr:mip family channel protein [Stylonychia lemnae]|eukprot:CDW77777.1 mip family channel protein [Stylonychia lemnae]
MKGNNQSQISPFIILLYEFCGSALVTYAFSLADGHDSLTRAYAYFLGFIIAYQISGAHFNPATSLAVFISEKNCKTFAAFAVTILSQYAGALAGIFVTYLLAKYRQFEIYPDFTKNQKGDFLYFNEDGDPYWGRLVLHEFLHTFTFTYVYLIVKYDKTMQKVDRLLQAFCLTFTLYVCNSFTLGSGAVFNPALGLAQSVYMIGVNNSNGSGLGSKQALVTWVYILVPYAGAAFAALFYLLHKKIDNAPEKQTEPMQFMSTKEAEQDDKQHLLLEDDNNNDNSSKDQSSKKVQQKPAQKQPLRQSKQDNKEGSKTKLDKPSQQHEIKAEPQQQVNYQKESNKIQQTESARSDLLEGLHMEHGEKNFEQQEQQPELEQRQIDYDDDGDDDILRNLAQAGQSVAVRAIAYIIGFIIAYNITGAHFNPATSLAIFITEKKFSEDLFYFLMVMLVQLCGCYTGCLVSYLQALISNEYGLYPESDDELYIYGDGFIWFGRVCLQEILQTFSFTLVYLILRYDQEYSKLNRAYKAIALFHVLVACYSMSYGAGACLNPAIGMSQSTYMIALDKRDDVTSAKGSAQAIWVYMVMPFIGSGIAAMFYGIHQTFNSQK